MKLKPSEFSRVNWEAKKPAPEKHNYWDSWNIDADSLKMWRATSFDEVIKLKFQQTEKQRYEKLDWCILYALGIGLEQSKFAIDHTNENWQLVVSGWKGSYTVLATIRTSLNGRTVVEFGDEFAAELCDQAYGDPRITAIYATEDDDNLLS